MIIELEDSEVAGGERREVDMGGKRYFLVGSVVACDRGMASRWSRCESAPRPPFHPTVVGGDSGNVINVSVTPPARKLGNDEVAEANDAIESTEGGLDKA